MDLEEDPFSADELVDDKVDLDDEHLEEISNSVPSFDVESPQTKSLRKREKPVREKRVTELLEMVESLVTVRMTIQNLIRSFTLAFPSDLSLLHEKIKAATCQADLEDIFGYSEDVDEFLNSEDLLGLMNSILELPVKDDRACLV